MAFIPFLVIAIAGGWAVWEYRFRRRPLAYFGIEKVQRVLKWTPPEYRERVWARNWLTSREWLLLLENQLHEIEAELRRRGQALD